MKKICSFLIFIACSLSACLEDKGNDIYVELNDLMIGEIRDTTVEQFTRLKIIPDLTTRNGDFNSENYDYLWHMYKTYNGINNPVESDTLSFEKDLNVEITSIPEQYTLVFEVTDKETGVQYFSKETQVTVINSYSAGMLVLSEVDGDANLTFVNVAGSIIEDMYQKVNGEVAGQNPTGVRYIGKGLVSQAEEMVVIMMDDERGGVVVKPFDMSYVMDFEGMFYFAPDVVKPQSFGTHDVAMYEYVNNNGKLYRRNCAESGYAKFGVAIEGDYGYIAPFDFYYSLIVYPMVAYFYDQGKERFVYMNVPLEGNSVITLPDVAGEFNPNNVGMQMLWGGLFGDPYMMNNGRAVMEDDNGERYALSFTVGGSNAGYFVPQKKFHLTYEGVGEAHTFTTSQSANLLYYSYGNKIACVSFSTGNLLGAPYEVEGGNIDYIECDQKGNTNQMWVGISDGSKAKNSGSILVLEMGTDGSLKEVARYDNICGKVVDFDYKN